MRGGAKMFKRTVIGGLILLHAATASGQQRPPTEETSNAPSPPADQVIYKGVVGNLLEALPLDPRDRVQLQRANTVLSSPLSARSVAVALGIASGPLMLVGLIWGLWSAAKIQRADAVAEFPLPLARRTSDPFWFYTAADDNDPAHRLQPAQLDRMPRHAKTASELAAIVGASGRADSGVSCDNCEQIPDWRAPIRNSP